MKSLVSHSLQNGLAFLLVLVNFLISPLLRTILLYSPLHGNHLQTLLHFGELFASTYSMLCLFSHGFSIFVLSRVFSQDLLQDLLLLILPDHLNFQVLLSLKIHFLILFKVVWVDFVPILGYRFRNNLGFILFGDLRI